VIAKPLCTPDPAVLLACKIAQHFEGLVLKPYLDPRGIPTIGYGSMYYEDGSKVTMDDPEITESRAKILLYSKMEGFVSIVDQTINVPLNSNQTAALGSFCYNVGPVAFEESTLVKLLNLGRYDAVPVQLLLWDHAGSEVLGGLEARREAEANLFKDGILPQ